MPTFQRLKEIFENPETFQDQYKSRKLMKSVVGMMTRKIDIQPIFSNVVKILAHPDIVVKKLACHCVTQHAEAEKDLVILAINTLLKDCVDSNPLIRGLAVKTLCALRHSQLTEYAVSPVERALEDRSPYVRRAAVLGCVKLHHANPHTMEDHGFLDTLYALIRDEDPIVVVNCVSALEEILEHEGGMVVNEHIANHLVNRMSEFNEWSVPTILKMLQKYKPKSVDDVYGIMDICDPLLKHSNSAVVIGCFQLFMHLVSDNAQLTSEVVKRASQSLTSILNSSNPELCCIVLDTIKDLVVQFTDIFAARYSSFFCKYNEPSYVKIPKIKLLSQLVCESNADEVIDELGMYCTDTSTQIVQAGVQALSTVAHNIHTAFANCAAKLLTLLELNQAHTTCAVLRSLQNIDLRKLENLRDALSALPRSVENLSDASGRSALYWLIGEYGEYIDDSPYIIESSIDSIDEEAECCVKLCLLTCTLKLFFKRPAECQDSLGRLLNHCFNDTNACVHDCAVTYGLLLKADLSWAKNIVLNPSNSGNQDKD